MNPKDMPDEQELVLCTVTKIYPHCVFASLDEFRNKQGMIHISEISPGRIRNIHNYVKLGKKIICKVLSINLERGHIDLSLRRVSEGQKREKAEEIKRLQKVQKIVEFVADKIKADPAKLHAEIKACITDEYDSLHDFFEFPVMKI
ncbi:S1 RNA-binding domain-containing protein [Nanoarchaeota archaeon]